MNGYLPKGISGLTESNSKKRITKWTGLFGVLGLSLFSLSAWTASRNALQDAENQEGKVAGFWQGWWHGFILLFTFIASLFNPDVGVYEAHNNGRWYNFGFLLGVMMFFGGGKGGSSQAFKQREAREDLNKQKL